MSAQPLPLPREKFARRCKDHHRVLSVMLRRIYNGDEEVLVCPEGHRLARYTPWEVANVETNVVVAYADIDGAITMTDEFLSLAQPKDWRIHGD